MVRTHKHPANRKVRQKRNKLPVTFTIEPSIAYDLKDFKNRSEIINKAIRFYLTWLYSPVKIMEFCKQRNEELFKSVLRRNYVFKVINKVK